MVKDDDDHRGIPRDANGDPIFLILPPGVQASYDRRLAKCEAGWRATGDPAFVKEAMIWVHLHRQPPPLWLSEAICALADNQRAARKSYITRLRSTAIKWMRFEAVRDAAVRRDVAWDGKDESAYEDAAQRLAGIPGAAARASTMKADYIEVKADLDAGRGGRYLQPLIARKKLGDVLKPAASPRRRPKRRTVT